MKKYCRLEDILIFQWLGDFTIIDEVNNSVKYFNEISDNKIKVKAYFDDDGFLIISNYHEYGTLSIVVNINNYIVFDVNNKQMPLNSYSEKMFNDKFILI